ncbi:uncharacterized protein EAF01_009760 [Botrytis porri]|uniref:Uncharacterized protein n=1 Tax=Botrytis porri TaxID=87229 RepID=A0A4Z1KRG5_9HELO|nr:uncharacterized protein EAF01_009760 [Botrytis porri]KAF7895798.1 hypothetical protein EAF01_009760 [Botrytis porri]TGO86984.1 hypothetical protein BPOR_0261g00020 [Botrytis porri]
MTRNLVQRSFIRRRVPIRNTGHGVPFILRDSRNAFQNVPRSPYSTRRHVVRPGISEYSLRNLRKDKRSTFMPTDKNYVPLRAWQKSKVWNKIFSPYYDPKKFQPWRLQSTPVPLWDIAPGCILFLPGVGKLDPLVCVELKKYGNIGMAGHPVVVLAVDMKGVNEALVAVAIVRSYSQHKEECRFLGYDWFDTKHFEIQQRGIHDLPPRLGHNIKTVRLYKTPCSNTSKSVRQFIETSAIATVPFQSLLTEARWNPKPHWWPSSCLDGWGRRIIKEDFMHIADTIGFSPDPWVSSGPYMWKDFVQKTGIDTFGLDIENPALYDEQAFYEQMWEEGRVKHNKYFGLPLDYVSGANDYSPLGWAFDRMPHTGLIRRRVHGMKSSYYRRFRLEIPTTFHISTQD